jgi:hypothetical protein
MRRVDPGLLRLFAACPNHTPDGVVCVNTMW